jgi:hypothetical protein
VSNLALDHPWAKVSISSRARVRVSDEVSIRLKNTSD